MESCSQLYTRKIVDSIVHGLEQRHSSILFVKHYNTLSVPIGSIEDAVAKTDSRIELLYHEFSASRMQEAYEPFLGWIKQLYYKFYYEVPIDDFLEQADVYFLSRSTIKSYITSGECERTEEIIVSEVEYERRQLANSLVNILLYISSEHTLFLVLNRLHLAENSTLNFLLEFIRKNYDNISLLANYNEAYVTPSYTLDIWSELVQEIEDLNYMLDWNIQDPQADVNIIESFEPTLHDFNDYLIKTNNMVLTLATQQALYYLDIIYNRLVSEKAVLNTKSLVKFYIIYAQAATYERNFTMALIMLDKLKNVNNKHPNIRYTFQYHYMLSVCEVYGGQASLARKNADKCIKIAKKSGSERLAVYAKVLDYMVRLDGWQSQYTWDRVNETESIALFRDKALKYKLYNHLAHTIFFGCGNSKESYNGDADKCENQESFAEAMNIAKMLKNERLMIAAWKKNVFLAQGFGYFAYVDYYYKKCLEIIEGQNDKLEEASIYNGLGFNRIVSEQFTLANDYFNRALYLFFKLKDSYNVAETLYNMATNAILAANYDIAYNYLLHVLKLLESVKMHRMRVCNISKVYGMIVYCSYKMGIEYNAHFYLNKMERVLHHLLHCEGEPNYFLWDDDMFFYYFVSGLLEKSDDMEKAQQHMDKAKFHMFRSEGLLFFVYAMFAEEQYDMYIAQGRKQEAEEILENCIELCNNKGYKHKEEMLFAKLHKQSLIEKHVPLPLTSVTKYQIEELAQLADMKMLLSDKTKGINFLVAWQELLNKANSTSDSIIEDSMITMQNNYNIDNIIYVDVVDHKPVIRFNGGDNPYKDEDLQGITDYLSRHKKEFVASRFDREFYEYTPILQLFGVNNIVSFACIPVSTNDELSGFMLASIELHENMTGNVIFLDRNDLTIFKFALRQMNDTIYRLKARDEINEMNIKLQKSAVTDLLTSLLNRQGFAKKIEDYTKLVESGRRQNIRACVLYLDLDNFKFCNDTFGHDVGDVVLKGFSRLCEEVVGDKGYIVRYGGDEFLIILPEYGLDEGERIAKAVYESLDKKSYFIPDIEATIHGKAEISEQHRVSVSIGVADMDIYDTAHMNAALKNADTMLYAIKKSGKSNYAVWNEETARGCQLIAESEEQ